MQETGNSKDWGRWVNKSKLLPKKYDEIKTFAKMFNNDVMLHAKGYLRTLKPLKSLFDEDNFKRSVSLWERVKNQEDNTEKRMLHFIAVEGPIGQKFIVEPSGSIFVGKGKVQYFWKLHYGVNEEMAGSVKLLSDAICFLHPGVKSLHTRYEAYLTLPGIPDLHTRKAPKLYLTSKQYTIGELWQIIGEKLPVKGRSLRKYLSSEKIYVEGLHTTHQFISLRRLNNLLSLKLTKTQFEKVKKSFFFLMWNFAIALGFKSNDIINLAQNFSLRKGYKIKSEDILDARPIKQYRFTNKKIVEMLGEQAAVLFPLKRIRKKKSRKKAGAQNTGDEENVYEDTSKIEILHIDSNSQQKNEEDITENEWDGTCCTKDSVQNSLGNFPSTDPDKPELKFCHLATKIIYSCSVPTDC